MDVFFTVVGGGGNSIETGTMRYLLALLLLLLASAVRADTTTADLLIDGESGSAGNTISAGTMSSLIHTSGTFPAGTWTVGGSTVKIAGSEQATLGSISVGGTTYAPGSGTRCIQFQDFYHEDNSYIRYSFTSSFSGNISAGFWFWSPTDTDGGAKWPDIFRFLASGGGWSVVQLHDSSTPTIVMHTGNDSSSTQTDGASITIAYATWYWISVSAVRNGTCNVRVYDTSGSLVGTSSRNPGITHNWASFDFGRADQHGVATSYSGHGLFDNLIMDFTDASDPLGPGEADDPTGPYWVSTTGAASWAAAQSETALSGSACASVSTMNTNAAAGDTVYLRSGTYPGSGTKISLSNDGASGNPIIIEAYQSEQVTFDNFSKAQGPAISLTNRDYITFRKIDTNNVQESLIMSGCTHLTFEDCEWLAAKNTASGYDMVIRISGGSQYNTFDTVRAGDLGYSADLAGVMILGTTNSESDATRYNYFVDCEFRHGGHHVIADFSSFNIFDRCFIHSEEWYGSGNTWSANGKYGGRGFITEDADLSAGDSIPEHGNDTFRDCIFFRCGDPDGSNGVSNMSLRTSRNRVIRTLFVDGSNNGISMTYGTADDNRVAHCVFARNGVSTPMTTADQRGAIMFFFAGGAAPNGNAVKNCIFVDNQSDVTYEDFSPGGQTLANNWLAADGSAAFVDWNTGDLDPTNSAAHDFHLQTGSGAINNGGWLTTATSTTSGTSLVVADSYWFTAGEGIAPGDVIQIQGSTSTHTITAINYSTHTLTITPSTSWTSGNGVGFPYFGSTPDQGAFESAAVVHNNKGLNKRRPRT